MNIRTLRAVLVMACLFLPGWSGAMESEGDFASIAKEAGQAVVNISAVQLVNPRERFERFFGQYPDMPIDEFMERFGRDLAQGIPKTSHRSALGSGFIISPDGYVVTANSVIARAVEITVLLSGEHAPLPAVIVGRDQDTDLALLKINAGRKLPALDFADSANLRAGEWALAIGNPFGLNQSVTLGIISATGRSIGAGPCDDFIQTDVSINPGNAGGPLLNLEGAVIGVNTAMVANGHGIGFSVPSNTARAVIAELKANGAVVRGWLGVEARDITVMTARALGLPSARGAMISEIFPDAPATQAGLKIGDVILRLGHEDIQTAADLLRIAAGRQPGEKTEVVVWRNGVALNLMAVIGRHAEGNPPQSRLLGDLEEPAATEGLTLRPVTESEGGGLGLDRGQGLLVLNVAADSPADMAGMLPGDIIVEAAREPASSLEQFRRALSASRQKTGVALLLIQRGGSNLYVTLALR